jgi:hypothetical protein
MLQDENERIIQKKETIIKDNIVNLRKAIAKGSSDDREYAIEALKDLNMQLERELK